jgi:hypothetical protein
MPAPPQARGRVSFTPRSFTTWVIEGVKRKELEQPYRSYMKSKTTSKKPMMQESDISRFERLQAQLQSLYTEIGVLAKNKPGDALNKFKLGLINKVLEEANTILDDESRPFGEFTQFDEDDMPTNSDVLLILSMYLNGLEKLRRVDGKVSDIRTGPPRKLKY